MPKQEEMESFASKKHLWIFGPPGVGKSTLAQGLKEELGIQSIIDSDDPFFAEDVKRFKNPHAIAFGLLRELCQKDHPCILASVGVIKHPHTIRVGLQAPLQILLSRKPEAYAHWQNLDGILGGGSVDNFEGFANAELVLDGCAPIEENIERIKQIWSPNV